MPSSVWPTSTVVMSERMGAPMRSSVMPRWVRRIGAAMAKITVVALSGVSAFLHGAARSKPALAVFGAPVPAADHACAALRSAGTRL